MSPARGKSLRESAEAIRAKNWFWRAAMSPEAGEHENFFIAKNRDSGSAKRAFNRHSQGVMTSATRRSSNARMIETTAAQAFPAISAIVDVVFPRIVRIAVQMCCGVVDRRASRALTPARQHFLKQDAVFSNVLVYSGCSASRFPSARSD
jgi:hypothetical protein